MKEIELLKWLLAEANYERQITENIAETYRAEMVKMANKGSRRHMLRHIILGIRWGYPACCVIRFVFESVARPYEPQGEKRGVIHRPERDSVFVPCGIFHHGERLEADT